MRAGLEQASLFQTLKRKPIQLARVKLAFGDVAMRQLLSAAEGDVVLSGHRLPIRSLFSRRRADRRIGPEPRRMAQDLFQTKSTRDSSPADIGEPTARLRMPAREQGIRRRARKVRAKIGGSVNLSQPLAEAEDASAVATADLARRIHGRRVQID